MDKRARTEYRRSTHRSNNSLPLIALIILCLWIPSIAYAADGNEGNSPLIVINAQQGIPISPSLYGANNIWYWVPQSSFGAYTGSLRENAGVSLLRYPGGFESEHYNWSDNTLDPAYKNYTATPGGSPADAIYDMGTGRVTFVMRTEDAFFADTAAAYKLWADQAASLVTQYGGQVHDWEIGNEWFHFGGASKHYNEYLQRYAKLISYYVPAMKAAALRSGFPIRIYISSNWVYPADMTTMQQYVTPAMWAQVDGIDVHVYTGVNPGTTGTYPPPPISEVPRYLEQIKKYSGKSLIYVSEWAADLNDNNHYGGLENANVMMQLFDQLSLSGVSMATYWPPVAASQAQADTITFLHDSIPYAPDADGQAFLWLSDSYRGEALTTKVMNSTVSCVAAKRRDHQLVVFVMGGDRALNETENVQVSGFHWGRIVSAQVLWASDTNVDRGPANISAIAAKKVSVNGMETAQFTINPGGPNRGNAWEIVKLVLGSNGGGMDNASHRH
jgi:hypothetical protein